MTALAGLFTGLVVVPSTIWIALAVHYHSRWRLVRLLVSLLPLVIVGAGLYYLPLFPWGAAVWLAAVVVTLVWWFSHRPKSDRDWMIGLDVLPRAELVGDTLTIHQFRNYGYTESGDPIPRYEERTFDLARLSSLDYFLSHWSGPVMAHTLVSFGFDDGQFLTVSVEARRERWQSYSPLWGIFHAYELIFVLGDERDIVRVRTNVRRERVYMYRVRLAPENLRRLLLDYIKQVELLAARPQWYNSVTSNCTTNLFYHRIHQIPWRLRPAIFLNGLSARTLYRLGFLCDSLPFQELEARSDLRVRALAAGDGPDFSQRLRTDLVLPKPWSETG